MSSCSLVAFMPDEELVRRCRLGEVDAFSMLYGRYRRPVLATAHRILRDHEDARDATQEIFLKLHLGLKDWDPQKSRLSTWLYRLATNHALDCWRMRRRRSREVLLSTDPELHDSCDRLAAEGPDPLGRTLLREQARRLLDCTRYLSERQRRLFHLRYIRGLALREIAELERCPVNTVKGLLFRAVHTVRAHDRARESCRMPCPVPARLPAHSSTMTRMADCRFPE
jgi:RNA polymerase sigma factor (sigma-70 family)